MSARSHPSISACQHSPRTIGSGSSRAIFSNLFQSRFGVASSDSTETAAKRLSRSTLSRKHSISSGVINSKLGSVSAG
jgi:hypothetical protein